MFLEREEGMIIERWEVKSIIEEGGWGWNGCGREVCSRWEIKEEEVKWCGG